MFQRVIRFVTLGLLVGGSLNGCADDAPAGSQRDAGVAPDDVDGVPDLGLPDGSDPGTVDVGRDVQGGDDTTDGGTDVALDGAADGVDGGGDILDDCLYVPLGGHLMVAVSTGRLVEAVVVQVELLALLR